MAVGLLYRWEEHNHGLEHKCGTCHTVLSSPRAKKTCFGIHEEVCTRYHKTLFFVGQSHHCEAQVDIGFEPSKQGMLMISSCHTTVELHDKRHRQIASIVQSIQKLDRVHVSVKPLHSKKKRDKRRKSWDDSEADGDQKDGTQGRGVEWDDQSSTLNEEEAEDKQHYWTAETRKAAKAERKAAKNQARFHVITQADMEIVQRSLHPELEKSTEEGNQVQNGQGLTDNKTIEDNIAFNNHTFKWGRLRQSIHQKKITKANDSKNSAVPDLEAQNEILDPILNSLGIRVIVSRATKERRSLETKLRNAITEDLLAFQNEQAEKMQRMAGYWRYVNRRTYNQMVKNNELWDWATGQKLPEIEEDELESIEGEGEENYMSGATSVGTPNGWSSECWDNETDVEGSPLGLKTSIGPDDEDLKTPTQQTFPDHELEDELLEYARERRENLSIPKLKASLHSPTLSIASLPSSPSLNENAKPLKPSSPNPSFHNKKDTRTPLQAIQILPPPPSPSLLSPTPTTHRISFPSPTTLLPTNTTDLGNRYRNLKNEVPAPCEEAKPKPKPKPTTPLDDEIQSTATVGTGRAVLVIVKGDVEGEEGWEIKGGKSKKAVFPKLGKGKAKAKGKGKIGMGMDFVGVARRGVV